MDGMVPSTFYKNILYRNIYLPSSVHWNKLWFGFISCEWIVNMRWDGFDLICLEYECYNNNGHSASGP